VELKGREKNDETERGVEAMLEAVLDEKIEELESESLSESTVTIVEVGETREAELDETREAELDETIEVDEDAEVGSSAAACRVVASFFRRKRRSLSKVFSDFQILGRISGSSDSCSSVKYMIVVCGL
jgi:hypothetical protein